MLFLDELPEFKRSTLEVLRQPLEEGRVTISRAASSLTYPARFMLVAAMNPCPCGYLRRPAAGLHLHPQPDQQYRSRISGPLLDRIDIQVAGAGGAFPGSGRSRRPAEGSAEMRAQVLKAREAQAPALCPGPASMPTPTCRPGS